MRLLIGILRFFLHRTYSSVSFMIFNFDILKLGRMKYTFIFSKVTDPILKVLGGIQYQNVMLYT